MDLPGPTVFRGGVRVWDQVLWLKASGKRGPHCSPSSSLVPKGAGRRVTQGVPWSYSSQGAQMAFVPEMPKCPGFARWKDSSLKWKQKDANVQKKRHWGSREQEAPPLRPPPTG